MPNAFVKNLERNARLSAADISAIEALCSTAREYSAKCDLIREGDAPGPMFIFLKGWGFRYKLLPEGGRQILAFLLPGDFCDMHTGVLDEMDHSISTVTTSLVAAVDRNVMDEFMGRSLAITKAFWLMQLVDLGVARSWIASMGRRSSEERVAHLMCEMFVRTRTNNTVLKEECAMPISQIMLADALGLTPVHVNRVLRKFKNAGVMRLSAGKLVISDIEELTRIAGFDETYLHRRLGLNE